jgi:hypothetical protein
MALPMIPASKHRHETTTFARQSSHEGTVSVGVFVGAAGFAGEEVFGELDDGFAGLDADVEDLLVYGEVAVEIPVLQALGEVDEVELVASEEGFE